MDTESRPTNIHEDLDQLQELLNNQTDGPGQENALKKKRKKNKKKQTQKKAESERNKRHFTPLKDKMSKSL